MSRRPQETGYETSVEDYPSDCAVELLDRFTLPEMEGCVIEYANDMVVHETVVYKYNTEEERLEIHRYFNRSKRKRKK